MSRILIICANYAPDFHFGGVVRCVVDLAEALVEQGHFVSVFTVRQVGEGIPESVKIYQRNINGVEVNYFCSPFAFDLPARLRSHVNSQSWTFAYIPVAWQVIGILSAKILSGKKIPYIFSPHGSLSRKLFKAHHLHKLLFWYLGLKYVVSAARTVVINSQYERDTLIKIASDRVRHLHVIPNIVNQHLPPLSPYQARYHY